MSAKIQKIGDTAKTLPHFIAPYTLFEEFQNTFHVERYATNSKKHHKLKTHGMYVIRYNRCTSRNKPQVHIQTPTPLSPYVVFILHLEAYILKQPHIIKQTVANNTGKNTHLYIKCYIVDMQYLNRIFINIYLNNKQPTNIFQF